jgi:hypothetical protein
MNQFSGTLRKYFSHEFPITFLLHFHGVEQLSTADVNEALEALGEAEALNLHNVSRT